MRIRRSRAQQSTAEGSRAKERRKGGKLLKGQGRFRAKRSLGGKITADSVIAV